MSDITSLRVRQSLYTWLQSSTLASDFHAGPPEDFDPNREDTKEWVFIQLTRMVRDKAPRPGSERFSVTITAEVHGRDTDEALGLAVMATKVTNALGLAKIPIYDYASSGDPQVGWLMLHEPDEREELTKGWQTIRIVITGVVQNLA